MTEKLKAEIEEFKEQCLQLWFCQSLADSYTNSSLFDHFIDENGKVFWMKAQARQLWDFWQSANAKPVNLLDEIKSVIEDYFKALNNRERGEIAANHALSRIQPILNMSWDEYNKEKGLGNYANLAQEASNVSNP